MAKSPREVDDLFSEQGSGEDTHLQGAGAERGEEEVEDRTSIAYYAARQQELYKRARDSAAEYWRKRGVKWPK